MNQPTLHPLNHGFEWQPIKGPFRRITDEQARAFNEKGFFALEDAIDSDIIARVIAELHDSSEIIGMY